MKNWQVELQGNSSDLQDLERCLSIPEYRVIKRDTSYYLTSTKFDSLGTPNEVRLLAAQLLPVIKGAVQLQSQGPLDIMLGGIDLLNENGKQGIRFIPISVALSCGLSCAKAELTVTNPDGSIQAGVKLPIAFLELSENDMAVKKALRLFSEAPIWVNLFRIYEVIEEDVAPKPLEVVRKMAEWKWATEKEIELFQWTANNAAVVGDDARHGYIKKRQGSINPSKPMTLDEAQRLISIILSQWLLSKLHLRNSENVD